MIRAIISPSGHVPLPDALRKRLRLEPGAEVVLEVSGQSLVVKPLSSAIPDWRSMEGMVGDGPSLTEELSEEHAAELEDERDRP